MEFAKDKAQKASSELIGIHFTPQRIGNVPELLFQFLLVVVGKGGLVLSVWTNITGGGESGSGDYLWEIFVFGNLVWVFAYEVVLK